MHYGILNSSGNALGWFADEAEARQALNEMLADAPDADVDLVAFEGAGRPVEPVSAAARSAWPVARLVWSSKETYDRNAGNVLIATLKVDSLDLSERADSTDDRVRLEA